MDKFSKLVEKWMAFPLLVVMFGAVLAQIVSRYVFGRPLIWTEELASLCFVWIVFLGAALSFYHNSMVKLDVFVDQLPQRAKKVLEKIYIAVFIIISAILIPYGIKLIVKVSPLMLYTLPLSWSFLFAASTVGMILVLIFGVFLLFQHRERRIDP